MKSILLATLACVIFAFQARADEAARNPVFSGIFELESCEPTCASIRIERGGLLPTHTFADVRGMRISVVDRLGVPFATCDGKQPYEFNIWLFGDRMRGSFDFMQNNFASTRDDYRKICDGAFSTDARSAQLLASKARIVLARESADRFALSWSDRRTGVSGRFFLKKTADRP